MDGERNAARLASELPPNLLDVNPRDSPRAQGKAQSVYHGTTQYHRGLSSSESHPKQCHGHHRKGRAKKRFSPHSLHEKAGPKSPE